MPELRFESASAALQLPPDFRKDPMRSSPADTDECTDELNAHSLTLNFALLGFAYCNLKIHLQTRHSGIEIIHVLVGMTYRSSSAVPDFKRKSTHKK